MSVLDLNVFPPAELELSIINLSCRKIDRRLGDEKIIRFDVTVGPKVVAIYMKASDAQSASMDKNAIYIQWIDFAYEMNEGNFKLIGILYNNWLLSCFSSEAEALAA